MTFGIAAVPALLMTGAAVDLSRQVTQRSNLQQATDATVLAITHNYLKPTSTCQSLYPAAQSYLTGAMNSAAPNLSSQQVGTVCGGTSVPGPVNAATLQTITISQNATQVCLKASLLMPTTLMSIANIATLSVSATSCSQIGGTYEVALALDNSYSMTESVGSQTKMQALHTAAIGLVNALIPSGTTAPVAAISLVPFNALVNVGNNPATGQPWAFMDTQGASSLNWKNIAAPSWVSNPSRFSLFSMLKASDGSSVAWAGCAEERPNDANSSLADQTNYLTTDVAATGGDSLFVPYFAPDDPGALNKAPPSSTSDTPAAYRRYFGLTDNDFSSSSWCATGSNDCYFNSYIADSGAKATGSCTQTDVNNDKKASTANPGDGMSMACRYRNTATAIAPPSGSATRYQGASQWFGLDVSPNADCTTPAITPLTTQSSTLVNAINAMQPTGLTNIGTGMMWAWRTISGLSGQPFFPASGNTTVKTPSPIGPKNPVPYTQAAGPPPNKKVIVLMTDGENSWAPYILSDNNNFGVSNPYKSNYEGFGFMYENRLSNYSTTCPNQVSPPAAQTGKGFVTDATLTGGNLPAYRCQMDNMMLEGCTNAKNAGIVIYTVGFSISSDPIDAEGQAVLQACASPGNAFIAANGNDIVTKFQQIAASILNLRISQ